MHHIGEHPVSSLLIYLYICMGFNFKAVLDGYIRLERYLISLLVLLVFTIVWEIIRGKIRRYRDGN